MLADDCSVMVCSSLAKSNVKPTSMIDRHTTDFNDEKMKLLENTVTEAIQVRMEQKWSPEPGKDWFQIVVERCRDLRSAEDELRWDIESLSQITTLFCYQSVYKDGENESPRVSLFVCGKLVLECETSFSNISSFVSECFLFIARTTVRKLFTEDELAMLQDYLKESEILSFGVSVLQGDQVAIRNHAQLRRDSNFDNFLSNTFNFLIKMKPKINVLELQLSPTASRDPSPTSKGLSISNGEITRKQFMTIASEYSNKAKLSIGEISTNLTSLASCPKEIYPPRADNVSTPSHSKSSDRQGRFGKFSLACQKIIATNQSPSSNLRSFYLQDKKMSLFSPAKKRDSASNLSIFALQAGNSCMNRVNTIDAEDFNKEYLELYERVTDCLDQLVADMSAKNSHSQILKNVNFQKACIRTGNKALLDALIEYGHTESTRKQTTCRIFTLMEDLHVKRENRTATPRSTLLSRFLASTVSSMAAIGLLSKEEKIAGMLLAYRKDVFPSLLTESLTVYLKDLAGQKSSAAADFAGHLKHILNLKSR